MGRGASAAQAATVSQQRTELLVAPRSSYRKLRAGGDARTGDPGDARGALEVTACHPPRRVAPHAAVATEAADVGVHRCCTHAEIRREMCGAAGLCEEPPDAHSDAA